MGRPSFGGSLKVPLLLNLVFFIGPDVVSSRLGRRRGGGVARANEHELHFLSFLVCLPHFRGSPHEIFPLSGRAWSEPRPGSPFWLGSSSEGNVWGARSGCQGHQIQRFGFGLFSPHQILSAPLIIPRKAANDDCGERE